jgi:Skp family chaperone for outer membrane proteins
MNKTGARKMKLMLNLFLVLCLFTLTGCQSAYYKTMEKFGYHKRDLLVDRVEDARDAQEEAKEQFQTALEKFSAVTNFQGGQLEEKYKSLSAELERSESRASAVRKHIGKVENVAEALFDEWESELSQYTNDSLRRASERKFRQTNRRYTQLIRIMKRAEAKIEPVLSAFRDQVLFLKHNLNAQAIASLQDEMVSVETEIASLIKEMEASIAEADAFIKEMAQE